MGQQKKKKRASKTVKNTDSDQVTISKPLLQPGEVPQYIPLSPLSQISGHDRATATFTRALSNPDYEVLESDKRLSECLLWKMQEDFYSNAGIEAWNQVPFYPTCNAFIGRTYAELILSFLLDTYQTLDASQPVYVIELAAGSGGLSFYVTKELAKRKAYYPELGPFQVVYVMTDFTENNVQAWEANPKFKPYAEQGLIDFAVFRPEDDTELYLRRTKRTLKQGEVSNPVVAVANYFFDTIRHDLFRIENGQLMEGRVNFYRPVNDENRYKAPTLQEIRKTEHFVKVSSNYYPDPVLNTILRQYQDTYRNASVLFPISSFKCLRNLQAIGQNKLALISSDKGFTYPEYMLDHWDQNYALHGSFSFMVNYHAIGQFFTNQGGLFFATQDKDVCLSTVFGILAPENEKPSFSHSRYYFSEKVDRENPINNLYFSQDLIHSLQVSNPVSVFRGCMSLLKLCNCDPIVFYFIGPYLDTILPHLDMQQRQTLIDAMSMVQDNFFLIRKDFNTLYWLGKLYYGLDRFEECLASYQQAIALFGPDSHALYYIAACYEVMGQDQEALDYYHQTLELEPDCQLTQAGFVRTYERVNARA